MFRNANILKIIIVMISLSIFSGCATDSVLFVTKTSLGLNLDTKPPEAEIAYDRTEGYFGPRYANGAVPPVVASVATDGKIINPKIKQIYATGNAARIITGKNVSNNDKPLLAKDAKMMVFGTSTTTGLKVGFSQTGPLPDSFLFGFKRKEFSYIPLGSKTENSQEVHVYPSVLATIESQTNISNTPGENKFGTKQFFATGYAAEQLASKPSIKELMQLEAEQSLAGSEQKMLEIKGLINEENKRAKAVVMCVTNQDDTIDNSVLNELIGKAPNISMGTRNALTTFKTGKTLTSYLESSAPDNSKNLFSVIDGITCVQHKNT